MTQKQLAAVLLILAALWHHCNAANVGVMADPVTGKVIPDALENRIHGTAKEAWVLDKISDAVDPLATTLDLSNAIAPLATSQQVVDAVAPLASTGYVAAAVGAITAESLGALTAEADPEFSAWLSTDPLAPLATTGYVDSAVAPLATTQQLADAVAPLASTGYVAAAVGAITAESLGALTAEADPEFTAWLSTDPLAPLASTSYVDAAVAPLATTQALAAAIAPLASTGYVTAAVAPLATTQQLADAVAPLATTQQLADAVAPLVTTQQLASAIAPLATTGSIAAASNHFEAAVGTASTNLGIASNALSQAIATSTASQTNYIPKSTNWATLGNRTWAPWNISSNNFSLGPFQIIPELQMYEVYPPGGMGPPGVQYGGRIDIDPLDDVDVVNFRGRKWRFDGAFPASSSELKSMAKLTPNHSFSADTDNIWELGKSAWVTDITPEPRGLLSQESTWKLEPGKSFSITNLGSYIFSMVSFAVPTDNRPVPISIFVDNQKTATFQPTPDGQTHFYNINAHAGNGSVVRMQLDDNTPGIPGADGYVLVLGETYFTGLEIFGLVKPDLYGNKISFHGQTVLVDVPEVPDAAVNLQYLDSRLRSEFAWPWGNVGLNVDEPEAQLDVGGNVLVRSNLVVHSGKIQLGDGDEDIVSNGRIIIWNCVEGRYDEFGQLSENDFSFGTLDGPKYGFGMDGQFGGNSESPWYDIAYGGVVFKNNPGDGTNRASIKVSVNPPGFIFNVNGVIWTNTP